ncbi:hypothetical protein SESBI_03030 [Sesbania bispinosa]|nr:hypothetical protein SESBI_03030 [Sesbania bispinosa]
MAYIRRTVSRVPPGGSASQSQAPLGDSDASDRYSWIDSTVCDAHSLVSEDDATTYLASFPVTLLRVDSPCNGGPGMRSSPLGFSGGLVFVYDYCLTTFGIRMPFSNFQIRVLSLGICPSQFHPNGWAFART